MHQKADAVSAVSRTLPLQTIEEHCRSGGRLWLFLDYDGTLLPIAPTPEQAKPDGALVELLQQLVQTPNFRVTILSGRGLASLSGMLPIPGLMLAGVYGIDIKNPDGTLLRRGDAADLRQTIEQVKEAWARLISGRKGLLLEDKGMSVALHARYAGAQDADFVLPRAVAIVAELPSDQYRILGGDRFLEIAPSSAHKGRSVEWLLDSGGFPGALPVYFGDDDKDEEAFSLVLERGGIPIIVGDRQPETQALVRLPSPSAARSLLRSFMRLSQQAQDTSPESTLVKRLPKDNR